MSHEGDILAANRAFYAAFRARDRGAMEAVWSRRDDLVCIHPGWAPLHGRKPVLASWARILSSAGNPPLVPAEEHVSIAGDAAIVLCLETANGEAIAAINVFVREDEGWRMLSHHGSPILAPPAASTARPAGPLH